MGCRGRSVRLAGGGLRTPSAARTASWPVATPREHHGDAARFEPGDRVAENPRAGGVDGRDARHAQDDDAHVGDLGDLEQELVRGAEEQRTVESVRDDVLVEQRTHLVGVVAGFEWCLADACGSGDGLQREDDRDTDADCHGGDQVDGNGHREGE